MIPSHRVPLLVRVAVLAGVGWAPWTASPLPAQALPGIPRAHPVDGPGGLLPSIIAGEFTGDGRADALVVRDAGVDLMHAVAAFGSTQRIPSPGGGRVAHVARIVGQGDRGRDLALLCVADGTAPGLHAVVVDDGKLATVSALGAPAWGGVRELVVLEDGDGTKVFGVDAAGTSIYTGTLRNRVWTAGATLDLPKEITSIRVSPWSSTGDRCLFVCTDDQIDVLTTEGAFVESIQTGHPIHDFDVGLSRYLGHGRLVAITWDAATGTSWFELHDPGSQFLQLQSLGVARPRIVVRDLLDRGDVDVCAVNSHGPSGFATFGGFGATPLTFDFTGTGLIPFSFASPGFGTAASHSNVDLFDTDGDGDGDVLFTDPVEQAVWVQPSWAIHEFLRAPTMVNVTPHYSHQNPAWQWIAFQLAMPELSAGLFPTHAEVVVYQVKGADDARERVLVAQDVVGVQVQPDLTFHTGVVAVYGDYEGPEATDADYVVCVRLLQINEAADGWAKYGVECFTGFHHHRTPDPANPGYYVYGTAGGVNPLPSTGGPAGGTGTGTVPPPPPPPPTGG